MEIILSAIASGGLVGIADQYMCLLIVSVASKIGWIELSEGTQFMGTWWFIAIVAIFWVLTVAPAYLSLVAPGVANAINTVISFLSGFLVPASSALIALASIGIIINLNPDAENILDTLRLFNLEAGSTASNLLVAGGGALVGTTLTGLKAVSKPAFSAATGTIGHISAPKYATLENGAAFLVMGLLYWLASLNPWLIVALGAIVLALAIGMFVYALTLLRKLASGTGEFIRLLQDHPKDGFTAVLEFFIWGSGWMISGNLSRGLPMLLGWILYWGLWWLFFGVGTVVHILLICLVPMSILLFFWIGSASSKALIATFDIAEPDLDE